MINKKEFDMLLQQIYQLENKIVEVKILNKFEKANEYENTLETIRFKAKDIELDNSDKSEGFDELSLQVLSELILLNSEIDYYILKTNNIIESNIENRVDAKTIEQIKRLWDSLEIDIKIWNSNSHNPIEEMEYNKHIGNVTLENIIFQLQKEGVIDFSKVFKYCKKDLLVNAIRKVLFEGAKEEFKEETRNRLINLAKKVSEQDLYDYKLWQQILIIKNTRSRDDHIEILGNLQEKSRNYIINDNYNQSFKEVDNNKKDLELVSEESILKIFKKFFSGIGENINQKSMDKRWGRDNGPAFKIEFSDKNIKYAREFIDKNTIKNAKKLIVATNGVAKYNFEKDAEWESLETLEFLEKERTSSVSLTPDKTYNCIGKEAFENCKKLKEISFGKIEMIGQKAFKNCTSITELTFSKRLMNIAEDGFLDCKNLRKVTFLGSLKLYILDRPQNILDCFKGTNLEEIVFFDIDTALNFVIIDCPSLKEIKVSNMNNLRIPFKYCKYRLGRQEGLAIFASEVSLNLWKKRNSTIRFFELTDEDKKKYNI